MIMSKLISGKLLTCAGAVVMTAGAVLFAQGGDAAKVLANMRQALGGGVAATEITIEKYKVNPTIDPKRFEPKK
jgi:hypothetical protein